MIQERPGALEPEASVAVDNSPLAQLDAEAAFAAMEARLAVAATGSSRLTRETSYAIAGHRLRLRVIGTGLAESVHGAWAHLAIAEDASSPGQLLIDLWDERETRIAHQEAADVIGPSPRVPFRISPDTRFVGHRLAQTLTWFDRRAGRIIGCVADRARLSAYERGRPLETPLLFWLRDRGMQLVHAALVSRRDDGVLLVGRSGSGKSTCALACVRAGFDFLGDDKVAVAPDGAGSYTGWSLTASAYLEPHHLARFTEFDRHAVHEASEQEAKSVVLLPRFRPRQLRARATIRALAIVRLATDQTAGRVRRASRREALLATAPNTLLQLPIEATRSLSTLADLVARVPAYSLGAGPDLDHLPRQVTAILDDALRSSPG